MADTSGVKIVVRIRNSDLDKKEECEKVVQPHKSENKILLLEDRPFVFDQILKEDISQENLYQYLIEPLVIKTISGFNSTVIAFGQSGSGKTYTIGLQLDTYQGEYAGIISRALDDVFLKTYSVNTQTDTAISVSYIEIYNEKVFDLLSSNFRDPINTKASKFTGGTKKPIQIPADAKQIIIEGNKNRHVRETKMNPKSSRSHAIFTIHLLTSDENSQKISALNLVDLAGSESVRRTGHQGIALSEGIHINQGLLCVSKVLHALSSGLKVIPYRDSILSTVLQDSLNLNSFLTLIACISPLSEDINETLSTLRYAKGAKLIKNNPQINAILADLQKSRIKTPTPKKPKRPASNIISTVKRLTPANRALFSPRDARKTIGYLQPKRQDENDIRLFRNNNFITSSVYKRKSMTKKDNTEFLNESLGSRPSSMHSFNISTSTAIEPPQIISPIVRKVCHEVKGIFDDKFKTLFDCIENLSVINQTAIDRKNDTTNSVINIDSKNEEKTVENNERLEWTFPKGPFLTDVLPQMEEIPIDQMSLSKISDDQCSNLNMNKTVKNPNVRRSVRISTRRNTFTKPLTPPTKPVSIRYSTRLSSVSQTKDIKSKNISKTVKRTTKTQVKDITEFFTRETINISKKTAKAKHQKSVLELINSGNIKEIQILPLIGLKTAFQIVTHRLINGRYKSFNELSKVNVWKGKSWIRFKEANHLD